MATSCTCDQKGRAEWAAPEQHSRYCPESLEQREIERLKERVKEQDQLEEVRKRQREEWIEEVGRLRIILDKLRRIIDEA